MQNAPDIKDISTYDSSTKVEQISPDKPENTSEPNYAGGILGGVEVVDVKAIEKKKPKMIIDKFGIPRHPNEYKNFDRI